MAANKHPGGSLSCVEALTAIYFSGQVSLHPDPSLSDHIVYSKGHAAAPYYFALWAHGFFPGMRLADLACFGQVGHPLPRMPQRSPEHGIDMSTGALGQGLSFACGMAVGLRRASSQSRVFAVLGDGECTEGQTWEAALSASRHGLRNVVALLDANGSGSVIELAQESWAPRWASFGWHVHDVPGHDLQRITDALAATEQATGPSIVILRTVKGMGLLGPMAGGNSLSGEVGPEYLPAFDLEQAVSGALQVVDHHFPDCASRRAGGPAGKPVTPAAGSAGKQATEALGDREQILAELRGAPVGEQISVKQVGGPLAQDLVGAPVMFMSPDAIRNSGILPHMLSVGAWSYDNPGSNVLQCAITEQDAASMAAGMAAVGLRPILFSMEGFYWRMLDQIRESICFPHLPVVLVGTSGGIGDPLGPMVQSDTCLLALTDLLGLTIFEAADANWARLLCAEALGAGIPAYIRLPHEPVLVRHDLAHIASLDLSDGAWIIKDHGKPDVTLVSVGAMRETALAAAALLETASGTGVRVVEVFCISRFRRLPAHRMEHLVHPGSLAVSVHNAPAQVLSPALPRRAVAIGTEGFGQCGWPLSRLYEEAGLTPEAVATRVGKALLAWESGTL
jgi:transketolase